MSARIDKEERNACGWPTRLEAAACARKTNFQPHAWRFVIGRQHTSLKNSQMFNRGIWGGFAVKRLSVCKRHSCCSTRSILSPEKPVWQDATCLFFRCQSPTSARVTSTMEGITIPDIHRHPHPWKWLREKEKKTEQEASAYCTRELFYVPPTYHWVAG